MNFSFRDMIILISMATTVILMTFTFTALGLADESVSENDIPEFNITSDKFDLVGQFPDNPGSPSKFKLRRNEELGDDSNNQVWLDGDTTAGTELVVINSGNTEDIQPGIFFNEWDSGNVTTTEASYNETGDYHVFDKGGYELFTQYHGYENKGEANMTITMQIEVREQPETDGGILKRIPVIGGVVSAGESVAGAVFWVGSILYWTLGTMFEIIINLAFMLYKVMAFFVSFMHWLTISYTGIISGANSFASVFVAIPGILLMVEFTKLILIGIKLLPTT